VDAKISPEPTDAEREAILAALDPPEADRPDGDESPWRRAALHEAVEGLGP
jgi:hypothetical protein